jgi:hypothetical protein
MGCLFSDRSAMSSTRTQAIEYRAASGAVPITIIERKSADSSASEDQGAGVCTIRAGGNIEGTAAARW